MARAGVKGTACKAGMPGARRGVGRGGLGVAGWGGGEHRRPRSGNKPWPWEYHIGMMMPRSSTGPGRAGRTDRWTSWGLIALAAAVAVGPVGHAAGQATVDAQPVGGSPDIPAWVAQQVP